MTILDAATLSTTTLADGIEWEVVAPGTHVIEETVRSTVIVVNVTAAKRQFVCGGIAGLALELSEVQMHTQLHTEAETRTVTVAGIMPCSLRDRKEAAVFRLPYADGVQQYLIHIEETSYAKLT